MRAPTLIFVLLAAATCSAPRAEPSPTLPATPVVAETAAAPAPAPVEPVEAPPREVVIAATGDLLVHRRVATSAAAHGGFDHVFAGLSRSVDQAAALAGDRQRLLTLVNLETPLTDRRVPPLNKLPPILGTTPAVGHALARAGVDVVSVANNHALDQRAAGLMDTLGAARAAGLVAVGGGPDDVAAYHPWVLRRGPVRIAVVGLTRYVNQGREPGVRVGRLTQSADVRAALARARQEADVVVAAVHWSSEWETEPLPSERRLARSLVEWGADLVLGTGPHVLMEVERLESPRGDALVAYSLGNLVSNQGLRYEVGTRPVRGQHPVTITPGARDAVLLSVLVTSPEPGRVAIERVAAIPMWTANNYWAVERREEEADDVHLVRLADGDPAVRQERGRAIADALGPEAPVLISD